MPEHQLDDPDVDTVAGHGLQHYAQEPWLSPEGVAWRDAPAASLDGNIAINGGAAAIYNGAGNTATLSGADLVGNQALDGPGGAVTNLGVLTITASAIVSNTSLGDGAAISNTGTLSLLNTTLGANISGGSGGALFNNGGTVVMVVSKSGGTEYHGTGYWYLRNED